MDYKIQDLQLRLLNHGYDIGTQQADGIFGSGTKNALIEFQQDYGLIPDGIYGPVSQAMVQSKCITGSHEPAGVGRLARFRMTKYICAAESDYSSNNKIIPIKDDNENIISYVDPIFFCHLALEGSGKLLDGRVLNVSGKYVKAPLVVQQVLLPTAQRLFGARFKYGGINETATKYLAFTILNQQYPWGKGTKNVPLEPFRSIATDMGTVPRSDQILRGIGGVIPFSTDVYILELDNLILPTGEVHNGWVKAVDVGSGIYGARIDWFVGTKQWMKQLRLREIWHIWFQGMEDRLPIHYSNNLKRT